MKKNNLAKLAVMSITSGLMLALPENASGEQTLIAKYDHSQNGQNNYQTSTRNRRYQVREDEQEEPNPASCRVHPGCEGKEPPETADAQGSCHAKSSCSGKMDTTNPNKAENKTQEEMDSKTNTNTINNNNANANKNDNSTMMRKKNKTCGSNGGCGGKGGCGHSNR